MEPYINENNGNIIGIVTNGNANIIKDKIEKLEIDFINLVPNKKFYKDFVKEISSTPTTLFVDSEGNILEISTGSYGKEGDIRFLKEKIDKLKK